MKNAGHLPGRARTGAGADEAVEQRKRRLKVAVVSDLLEEGWHSMDLVADSLLAALEHHHGGSITAERIRPPMRRRASRFVHAADYLSIGPRRAQRTLFNVDRVANRFWDYPRFLRRHRARFDVFHIVDHSYAQLAHAVAPERTVVTCHDLEAFRCLLEPDRDPRPRFYRAMAERILDGFLRAAFIVCDSATVRDEILAYGLVPPPRLAVIPLGVHPACTPHPNLAADFEAEGLLGPVPGGAIELLHVGSTIPRKRIESLLRIFAEVRKSFPSARLVRVGGSFTISQERLADELGLRDSIAVLPPLDRDVLAAVYRRAALVLVPSSAEGFGLPVVEAMASGTPVIASDLAVLREVGGEPTTYCAVDDVAGWASAIKAALGVMANDPAQWPVRKEAAVQRAELFSWAEYARKMVALYNQIADR